MSEHQHQREPAASFGLSILWKGMFAQNQILCYACIMRSICPVLFHYASSFFKVSLLALIFYSEPSATEKRTLSDFQMCPDGLSSI